MLTVICPNCRHRFPAPGCCEPPPPAVQPGHLHPTCYYGGLLLPRNYTSGGGCFINGPALLQAPPHLEPPLNGHLEAPTSLQNLLEAVQGRAPGRTEAPGGQNPDERRNNGPGGAECHITSSCDLAGGSVTITKGIQSGGCLIQSSDSGGVLQTPRVEIRPKLTGGGCLIQKNVPSDADEERNTGIAGAAGTMEGLEGREGHQVFLLPPSGCQELPGIRRTRQTFQGVLTEANCPLDAAKNGFDEDRSLSATQNIGFPEVRVRKGSTEEKNMDGSDGRGNANCCCGNGGQQAVRAEGHLGAGTGRTAEAEASGSGLLETGAGVQIRVNATLQLPASLGQCTVNITATAGGQQAEVSSNALRNRKNLNGGGLVQESRSEGEEEERERSPTTPVSWLMPCPWGFDAYLLDRDVQRLSEVRRSLQACGWYHEGLSWQQSETLLKNKSVGRWLMRDSSDSRYTFAVSVQTARGPTSVRVHYLLGRFRLDAQPRLAFAMPLFDCPIKMLEYYVEYSRTVDENRKEVWVDYSGQVYSEIYLTRPLVKEVRALSHLARLVVNRCKLNTDNLPPLIRNYLEEYPYTL